MPMGRRAGLDRSLNTLDTIFTTAGLVLTGIIATAGLAALLYVAHHVITTEDPPLGTQGEWFWGGLAALIATGWGLAQAWGFYARLRSMRVRESDE